MRIRDMREDRDLTQKQLADYLHIRQNTYSQYELGGHSLPGGGADEAGGFLRCQ